MRKSIVVSLLSAIILSGCGGSSAHSPFTSTGYQSMQYQTAVDELSNSGFTNITTEPKETTSENLDGLADRITIDGSTTFVSDIRYNSDAPVVVRYYVYTAPAPTPTPEPTATPEPTPASLDKDTALQLDAELAQYTAAMETDYNAFLSSVASGDIGTNLDAYNAAKELSDGLSSVASAVISLENPGDDAYSTYAGYVFDYALTMQEVPDACMVYIDDGKTSSLSAMQDAISSVQHSAVSVASSRVAFLQSAGLTPEEIDGALNIE